MPLTTESSLAAITSHSRGFADAARDRLDAPVAHCPGWSVADLVHHLTEVHWFWAYVAEERPADPPRDVEPPPRVDDHLLVRAFEAGARRLVDVLAATDQSLPCWTWAPQQQDVAFVTRHQVQEAAVHHWDAAHATGGTATIDPAVAADSVDEFLAFSVSSAADPLDPLPPALDGTLAIVATDAGAAWTVTDGDVPGTAAVTEGAGPEAPAVRGRAADLLLWLYGRVETQQVGSGVPPALLARFRALCDTD